MLIQTRLKRKGKILKVYLKANNSSTKTNFNQAGKKYNALFNQYLALPAIACGERSWVATAALNDVRQSNGIAKPEYQTDPKVVYLGNLPVTACEFSSSMQSTRFMRVEHIGLFTIVSGGTDSHSLTQDETMLALESVINTSKKLNPYLPPNTDHTLDYITTKAIYLASTQSLICPDLYKDADSILYINY